MLRWDGEVGYGAEWDMDGSLGLNSPYQYAKGTTKKDQLTCMFGIPTDVVTVAPWRARVSEPDQEGFVLHRTSPERDSPDSACLVHGRGSSCSGTCCCVAAVP